ncbi:MAG TPA: WbqC family protein [Thermoanaerobaculia bacterium]|jgi:hypothetical protein
MAKRVAVLQSNYIPWKGYFDIIHDVDEFIFYDDLQYTKNDWRNRNRIKTAHGVAWLTIPVGMRTQRRMCDVELPRSDWADQHWRRLEAAYAAAPFFRQYRAALEPLFHDPALRLLSDLNQALIRTIAHDLLRIPTLFRDSREFQIEGTKQDRLLDLLQQAQAEVYVSGPAARAYLDPQRFTDSGIALRWKDYSGYAEYPQLHPPFEHAVTILDLLFHLGDEAPAYIWGWRNESAHE